MARIRFTEEQILAVLREHEAGVKAADPARKHGVSEATLYNWKAKYGGLAQLQDTSRLRRSSHRNRPSRRVNQGLRALTDCSHRAERRIINRSSNRH
jgi:putative transposase